MFNRIGEGMPAAQRLAELPAEVPPQREMGVVVLFEGKLPSKPKERSWTGFDTDSVLRECLANMLDQ